jgi:Flp pilus assembly protein TadG
MNARPSPVSRNARRFPSTRQQGAIALMSVWVMIMMIAFCGLAVELSQVYNRKVELNGLAHAVAIAAARELNGTPGGVDNAVTQAKKVVAGAKYGYGKTTFAWSDALLSFASSPTAATWSSAGDAKSAATVKSIYFVRVNTGELSDSASSVAMVLMPVLGDSFSNVRLQEVAIAGRTSIKVMPLAICAMSTDAGSNRINSVTSGGVTTTKEELIQYGFRRGVSYDLMQLNPGGTTPENFILDPFLGPGVNSATVTTSAEALSQFVCVGEMWMPRVTGGTLKVARPFPIGSLYQQLNSRFDIYDATAPEDQRCKPKSAPPDVNIKQYNTAAGGVAWMSPTPTVVSPSSSTIAAVPPDPGRLQSVADLPELPSGQTAANYGPLWSYAKAVPFSQYAAGVPEPAAGYTPFLTGDWGTLYKPNSANTAAATSGYPGTTPYMNTTATFSSKAALSRQPLAERNRRVLNVPLLSCPVAAGASSSATVLAVGKFFMTVQATDTRLIAEFAGIVPEASLRGRVEVFQ